MPSTRISVRKKYSPQQRQAIAEAVHAALVEAIRIPAGDRCVRINEYEPGDFLVKPAQTENFTLVEVQMFAGRSVEAKRGLYRAIVRNLEALGIAPDDTKIVLMDVPAENWGIRGGQCAADIDLGFKINV